MTARVPLSSVASSLLCLEKQNYMRSRCTNSTQSIQYPHAGRCLLSTELHRGFYTFPRGCCFPRQAAQNPAARNHARTEKLQGSYILVYKPETVITFHTYWHSLQSLYLLFLIVPLKLLLTQVQHVLFYIHNHLIFVLLYVYRW